MHMPVGHLQAADPSDFEKEDSMLPHMGILLFGDSVDFRYPRYLCNIALGVEAAVFNRENAPDPHNLASAPAHGTWLAA
jgi:hypothetical protein